MTEETTITKTEANPLALIQTALDNNIDPERLGKLLDLQERWERNKSIEAYSAAMNACQAEMPIVVKDRENDFTKARYATLECVIHTIKPIYSAHGFSISFNEEPGPNENLILMRATVRHSGGYSEQFTTMVPLDNQGAKGNSNKTGTQAKGSTLTYARRYLTLMIFNVAVANEDLDGNPQNATLTDEEISTIKTIVDGCRSSGVTMDMNKFMSIFGVTTIADIPRSKFASAVDMLSKKLASAKKTEAPRA